MATSRLVRHKLALIKLRMFSLVAVYAVLDLVPERSY